MTMMTRPFGNTGLLVPILGFGAGQIGDGALPDLQVQRVFDTLRELGITLLDTAPSYGLSEERIGRLLKGRRQAFVLSTKGGYGVPGVPDWTPAAVRGSIEQALRRLCTDHIDIFHLHSCPLDVLCREDILQALAEAQARGQVRVLAYSGENEALSFSVRSGRFGSVQASLNLFDQRTLSEVLPQAAFAGLGFIGKRPLGNAPWRFAQRPQGHYSEVYWERMQAMQLPYGPDEWLEKALRFAAFAPGVSCIIAGTSDPEHLRKNADLVARGPLPDEEVARIREVFRNRDRGWVGQV